MRKTLLAAAMVLFGTQLAHGQTAQAYINGAKARMSKNKFADARKVLAEHMDEYADNAEMHYLYGITLAKVAADSVPKAIEEFTIADSLNGEPGEGDELQGKIDQAIAALWGPLVNDGIRMLSQGKVDEAQAKLETAVKVKPDGKEGHLALGAVYQAKKQYDAAAEQYRKALDIDKDYKQALLRLGQVYQLKAQDYVESGDSTKVAQATEVAGKAAEVYQSYLDDNPGDLDVQIQLAGLYATLGQNEKAEPIIREVLQSDSVSAQVYTEFGFRLANAGQNDLAEDLLEKAVTLSDSTWSEPLSYLAFVKIRKEELPDAEAVLRKELELDPSNPDAWEYLGYVERDLKKTDEAQKAFQKAQNIPLALQSVAMSQKADSTWTVQATFANRLDSPVQNVKVEFRLVSEDGQVLETQQANVAEEALAKDQAEKVQVDFTTKATNPRVRYEIL